MDGKPGGKKISLVDYFYVKVSPPLATLIAVQSSSSTTWVALHHGQEEYVLAHGGTFPSDPVDGRSAKLPPVNVSCPNSTNAKPPHSSKSLALYLPPPHVSN